MFKNANPEEVKRIRKEQLYGIEFDDGLFTLAVTNMIIRQDGKSNIYKGDCFNADITNEVKSKNINTGLVNPPYSQTIPSTAIHEWSDVMKFLIYSDVHLENCFQRDLIEFNLYQNKIREIRIKKSRKLLKLTRPKLNDLVLHYFLDALSIINIKAKELGCDHVVNLGDTFPSSRFFNLNYYEEEVEKKKQLMQRFRESLNKDDARMNLFLTERYNADLKKIAESTKKHNARMKLFLSKHYNLIKEVFGNHIILSGNHDPFYLPSQLSEIFTYINKPTVMFGQYFF